MSIRAIFIFAAATTTAIHVAISASTSTFTSTPEHPHLCVSPPRRFPPPAVRSPSSALPRSPPLLLSPVRFKIRVSRARVYGCHASKVPAIRRDRIAVGSSVDRYRRRSRIFTFSLVPSPPHLGPSGKAALAIPGVPFVARESGTFHVDWPDSRRRVDGSPRSLDESDFVLAWSRSVLSLCVCVYVCVCACTRASARSTARW